MMESSADSVRSGTPITRSQEFNFRDVSPMRIGSHAGLLPNRLFRSGCPEKTTIEDFVEKIISSKIRTIIDLRSADESTASDIHLAALSGVQIIKIPFFKRIRREWENPKERDPRSTAGRYLEMIEASGRSPARIFKVIARTNASPVLIHCAAGRDRTGMVYTLILASLGIKKEEIAEDYAMSNDAVTDGYGARRETVIELIQLIEEKYGKMQNLLRRIGISEAMVRRVESLYTGKIA